MPVYVYKARDQGDQVISGRMEADTEEDLVRKIRGMNYIITGITQVREKKGAQTGAVHAGEKVKQKDILNFMVKLSSMLQVGISLPAGVRIIRDQTKNPGFKRVLEAIYTSISTGTSFSVSLSYYPNAFPSMLVRMVQVGETTGKLSDILTEYAEYAENQANIRSQIKSALTYPAAVISIAGVVIYIFLAFVIPRFMEMFREVDIELPLPTRILLNMSDFCRNYWVYAIIGIVLLFIGYRLGKRMAGFIRALDRIKLKIPGVGVLLRKMIQARFAQTIGLMYQSGVPILESINVTEKIVGNTQYSEAVHGLFNHVKDGKRISDYIKANPLFSADIAEMVDVGESSGRLGDMMQKSALFYRKEIDGAVKAMLTLMEPIIICFLGGCIAFLALSVVLPIFKMMSSLG